MGATRGEGWEAGEKNEQGEGGGKMPGEVTGRVKKNAAEERKSSAAGDASIDTTLEGLFLLTTDPDKIFCQRGMVGDNFGILL